MVNSHSIEDWARLKQDYLPECFAHWTDEATRTFKHDGYTGNDEYANACAGPSEEPCPVCEEFWKKAVHYKTARVRATGQFVSIVLVHSDYHFFIVQCPDGQRQFDANELDSFCL